MIMRSIEVKCRGKAGVLETDESVLDEVGVGACGRGGASRSKIIICVEMDKSELYMTASVFSVCV